MPGGSLTITVPTYEMLQQVAQRVTCWAGGPGGFDNRQIRVLSTNTPNQALWVPEEIFAAHGPLVMEPGGSDVLSGYVAGTNITFAANNATTAFQNPTTCAADNAEAPVINSLATNVGSNPRAVTLDYANFAGNGTVNVSWGDGTSTLGAAESNAALAHTYPNTGVFTIRVTDASVTTVWTETTVKIP